MSRDKIDYLTRRAEESRAKAAACVDEATRQTHESFAAAYEARIAEIVEPSGTNDMIISD